MADNSFKSLARRLESRDQEIRRNGARALRTAALVADRLLVFGTPVDTGRARGGWIANINTPLRASAELNRKDKAGSETLSRNERVINGYRLGQTLFLSNFVPYIGVLNRGSSAQAPAGFVQDAVSQAVSFLQRFSFTE